MSWLPQRPWLLPGSVADNVRLGRPDADDDTIWAALARVGLDDHVRRLPGGLAAGVGEDGELLSAGQRARLVLARAVVAARPLVLVDEPSAHLDAESERTILETLLWLSHSATVVVVTHSDAVVALADHVVRLTPTVDPAAGERSRPALRLAPAPVTAPVTAPAAEPAREPERASRRPDLPAEEPAPSRTRLRLAAAIALGVLATSSGMALTVTSGWLITRAAEHPPVLYLMVAIIGVRTFGLARPALRYVERLLGHDTALRLLAERRVDVYERVVPLTPGRLGRHRGDVLASIVDDVDAVVDQQLRVRAPLVTAGAVAALAVAVAGWLLPAAAAVVLAGVLLVGLVTLVVRRAVRGAELAVVRDRAELSSSVLCTLAGARDLALWQAAEQAVRSVDTAAAALARSTRRAAVRVALGRAAVLALGGATLVGVAGLASAAVVGGSLGGPTAAALVLLPLALAEALAGTPEAAAIAARTASANERLTALAGTDPLVVDPAVPVPLDGDGARVRLDDVSASWAGPPVLSGVRADVSRGRRLGVVGPSGSGKSTLAALLVRFLDPSGGRVTLDGTDLRAASLSDVRRQVALVDDDPYVFSSSVLENVRLARPGASRAEVEQAVRLVSLGTWLDTLPHGVDTLLGEGHSAVSGGERARLGLARAVLADSPVLVLDEPTAHLDTATALEVSADVLRAAQDRAVVWITHDRVALDAMDEVLVVGGYVDRRDVPGAAGSTDCTGTTGLEGQAAEAG